MSKVVVSAFVSLDGVVQAPGGPDEDGEGGFTHGGWVVPLFDEEWLQFVVESTNRASALLLGRKTYDIFAATWPLAAADDPVGAKLNSVPKFVASRTPRTLTWNNSTQFDGDIAEEINRLKREFDGELQVHGSGDFVQTLLRHDLVDEFRLSIFPVLIGSGKRLFANGTLPGKLKLVDSKTSSNGVTINTYVRDGDLAYGAAGPEVQEDWYAQ